MTGFARVPLWRRGYHRRQVDGFLNQVELALTGAMPPPAASEIRQVGFELAFGGYRTDEVDAALDALEERVLADQGRAGRRRGRVDTAGEVAHLVGELTAPYMQRFPRAGTLHRGYDVDEVDEFLDRVVATLRGEGRVPVAEVRDAPFRPRRGGYSEEAVDEMLDRVVELLLVIEPRIGETHRSGGP